MDWMYQKLTIFTVNVVGLFYKRHKGHIAHLIRIAITINSTPCYQNKNSRQVEIILFKKILKMFCKYYYVSIKSHVVSVFRRFSKIFSIYSCAKNNNPHFGPLFLKDIDLNKPKPTLLENAFTEISDV